ncbi:SDR family oxidoreductase [Melioribacteraceae bacterium 4301-Me]|uniref:SDR family oxidoreductase n=1 Tax=Pyranulibacter aquaticus TaxID=3163344 RepID=UPI003594D6BD
MSKSLIIVGAAGRLGTESIKFFLEKDYDEYCLVSRRKIEINGKILKKHKQIVIDDLANENQAKNLFEQISFMPNSTYFLFSTIGGFYGGTELKDTPYEQWLKMFSINLNTAFLLSKYFLSKVSGTRGGSICFTSALSGFSPQKDKAAYGASKNALNYLVETLAKESKKYNISTNAVAPYVIDSEESRKWIEDKKQLSTPQSIAQVVHFIFDNYKIINGNIIKLEGTLE